MCTELDISLRLKVLPRIFGQLSTGFEINLSFQIDQKIARNFQILDTSVVSFCTPEKVSKIMVPLSYDIQKSSLEVNFLFFITMQVPNLSIFFHSGFYTTGKI